MKKRVLSLTLSLILALSLMPNAFAAEGVGGFNDVPQGAWYTEELAYALENGYVSGTSSTTFSPSANVSRGQFVTMLGRMLDVKTADYTARRFDDVDPSSWYGPYVAWAADKGYVNGVSKTEFKPDHTITFQEMAVILDNYIKKSGVSLSGYTPSEEYTDAATVSTWAKSSVEAVRGYGLLPTVDGAVRPHASVSRAEATVALVRLAKAAGLGHAPVEQPKPPVTEQRPSTTGDIFSRFILDDPKPVLRFRYDDKDSIDSNIRYMFKNGLSELDVTVEYDAEGSIWFGPDPCDINPGWCAVWDDSNWSAGFEYEPFQKVVEKYSYLGCAYDLVWKMESWDKSSTVVEQTIVIVKPIDDDVVMSTLAKAAEVHDALWASGKITSTVTQKEKARVYYDWLISHCSYDYESVPSSLDEVIADATFGSAAHTAYGALVDGKAVCDGYSAAYNIFLAMEGITCTGVNSESSVHGWNAAVLDGTLYHIDVTYGDAPGKEDVYFCMTPDEAWARFGGYQKDSK